MLLHTRKFAELLGLLTVLFQILDVCPGCHLLWELLPPLWCRDYFTTLRVQSSILLYYKMR